MATLVLAEHNNEEFNAATLNVVTAALELGADVDILVENYRPGTMARFGLDHERIKTLNPTVIYASISVSISAAFAEIAVPMALVIYSAINFHHYIVDSYIWKMRKPAIQKTMDIEEVPH